VEMTGVEPVSFLFNNKWLHVYSVSSQQTNKRFLFWHRYQ